MHRSAILSVFLLAGLTALTPHPAGGESPEEVRAGALRLHRDGSYQKALEQFRRLALDPKADTRRVGEDLAMAVACLQQLNRSEETDALREQYAAVHAKDWRALAGAARSWLDADHTGFIVAGEFHRGPQRGGGRFVSSAERDRVRALQLFEEARRLSAGEPSGSDLAHLYRRYADALLANRGLGGAWRLQELTDLAILPDYEEGYLSRGDVRGAPVGADGEPVFHLAPERFEDARTDGERWRGLLDAIVRKDPARTDEVGMLLADFARAQFGEQTLQEYADLLRDEGDGKERTGTWALHTLGEEETIARLATGVRRFPLPAAYSYLGIYRRIADHRGGYGAQALQALGETFENRRQYEKAAAIWQRRIEEHGDDHGQTYRRRIDQIRRPWGEFEPVMTHPAGRGAAIGFRFRNGRRISFEAREIDVRRLLADLKDHLRANPRELDWRRMNIEEIGYRLVQEKETKYVGRRVASWELPLEPLPNHFDRRLTIATPLQKAGAYLLAARMEDGNESRIVVWVNDTVIVRKPLDGRDWFFTADAVSGRPLPGLSLEFFGYRQEATDWQKIVGRRYNVLTEAFTALTDRDGQAAPDPVGKLSSRATWLITASGGERLAYLGWSSVWHNRSYDAEYNQTKVYTVTDRPVYRPDQPVRFKVWVRQAKYDEEGPSVYARRSFTLQLFNPRSEKVLEKQLAADDFGGIDGEYPLPADAALGVWRLNIEGYGGGTFRVEEYKKPEFEVLVEAPPEPVRLGERITARIKARYYFGAPVVNAVVKYSIRRTPHTARWYPAGLWDWCYGPGYWWFAPDYPWYPGWRLWGIGRPAPFWWPVPAAPPEVVAEREVRIGEDGEVAVEIDTALAKELHGDEDHRYEITAEVTDRSRRTIVGTGEIIVARKPFAVYAWVDRGHYRTGDPVLAEFSAQTLDHKPVVGKGALQLHRVSYRGGKPEESPVQEWRLDTDAEGRARLPVRAAKAGQYRLSYEVTDAAGRRAAGGYLFTVAGEGFDGRDCRFNAIELIPDRREYAPGDTVRLRINTDRPESTVVLFVRPTNGVYLPPQVLRLPGKTTVVEIPVVKRDMPNFFVEAFTVADGRLSSELREIVVPPEKKVLAVTPLPSAERYLPGQQAQVKVQVTDLAGRPVTGALALAVYDQSVEYIAGGSNVPEIRAFFWKWRRRHHPVAVSNLDRWFANLVRPGDAGMRPLGIFGHLVPGEMDDDAAKDVRGGARRRDESKMMRAAAPAPAAAPMAEFGAKKEDLRPEMAAVVVMDKPQETGSAATVEPTVRREFADTAFWAPSLVAGKDGVAVATFRMPENLTGWKIRAWAMGGGTAVGEGTASVVTAKNLILRLQAPRFFVEKDEVVLSANIHNYLPRDTAVRAVLELDGGRLEPLGPATQTVAVAANSEARVDWRVKAVREGEAVVRMKALTGEESDAVEMRFPVFVHGMLKTESFSGVVRPDATGATFRFAVPAERRIEQTRLEVRWSPTLAGAMVDALPYLVDYPYGCTEQTLNRFLPTVITQKVLREMGIDLAAVRAKRTNLNAQEIGADRERAQQWQRRRREPAFDEASVRDMARAGVRRLAAMQLADGGWGWFSGWGEQSWPHTTAVVVHGLQIAVENGADLSAGMLESGTAWLAAYQERETGRLRHAAGKIGRWKLHADNEDALAFMVLADAGKENDEMREFLFRDRTRLSVYGLALFGLGLQKRGHTEELTAILDLIEQYLKEDPENQTAWLNLPGEGWWFWSGSEFETHAAYLKLLARTAPKSPRAAGLVKYLLNNRKHATYWSATRDTALCIEALADYLRASGEDRPEMTVEILLDGVKKKEARITADNLFAFENALVLEGPALGAGPHTLEVRRSGRGAVYCNAYLTVFTLEDFIAKTGLEIKVDRAVYRLRRVDRAVAVSGSGGQAVAQRVERFERDPLRDGDTVKSGDLVEVELTIESKNDYEYLVFEDMKAAGFEPVEVRSGYAGDSLGAYREMRDERTAFFVRLLPRGKHSLAYRLRAEIPGRFSALPTRAWAMYAPELKGNADEIRLGIVDE